MNNLSNKASQVHAILQDYISIHDQIFKPSLRKSIGIPGFFKAIDFGKHFEDLGVLSKALGELTISDDLDDQHHVFTEYVTALLQTINELRILCKKLSLRSEGGAYTMEEYKDDVTSYHDSAAKYREIGSKLNLHLSKTKMMGGMAKRPKSRMLISHFIHIIAGLLFPNVFLWTGGAIWAVVLLSLITQGIDRIRIYRHYQSEFELIDRIHGIKQGRDIVFEMGTLFKHAQALIFKVIWYGLVTMVAAGFRR